MAIIGFVKVQSSTIENKYLRVKSINIGACLYEVYDKQKKINLILNLGPTKNYGSKNFYVGATCGRYAGRISNSKFKIKNRKIIDLFIVLINICSHFLLDQHYEPYFHKNQP